MKRLSLDVNGIVQGVGFRPFVYRTAKDYSLTGLVRNTAFGVHIEIQGINSDTDLFIHDLYNKHPEAAVIKSVNILEISLKDEEEFVILSSDNGINNTLISPDLGICRNCINDISDKNNRRFQYPFTNCTDCGPRFTLIFDIPYDRKNTTMKGFDMCQDCLQEYQNPDDRRFHAQPNACTVCGPSLSFHTDDNVTFTDCIENFNTFIENGKIVAVKGLGGYHLVCDAENNEAVSKLRDYKKRYKKPLAVMMKDIKTVKEYCRLNDCEEKLLNSTAKPIVLLEKKSDCKIASCVSMNDKRLGVMLPYTPLHILIMQKFSALVMTSGNLSDMPMIFNDNEALKKLPMASDAVLSHNRPIFRRMDDSVSIVINNKIHLIRRARGYVPSPVNFYGSNYNILAVGGQLKNTFCLTKGNNAIISGHIGDLDDEDTDKTFKTEIQDFIKIFECEPEVIACDYHPDYISTRYAKSLSQGRQLIKVQHHHAHFASALSEHSKDIDMATGFIFDGTGLGTDGTVWGGEMLSGDIAESRRQGHLLCFQLLGNEAAVSDTRRTALSVLSIAIGEREALEFMPDFRTKGEILLKAGSRNINSPVTSSMGRLFDAVSALTGICTFSSYEGEAAVLLQRAMDTCANGTYCINISNKNDMLIFDWRQMICDIVNDLKKGISPGTISIKFHRAVVKLIVDSALAEKKRTLSDTVVLSGGVFQNDFLLQNSVNELTRQGFNVLTNELVPINDGGISYGQAACAAAKMR